jgi:hypothetical protein
MTNKEILSQLKKEFGRNVYGYNSNKDGNLIYRKDKINKTKFSLIVCKTYNNRIQYSLCVGLRRWITLDYDRKNFFQLIACVKSALKFHRTIIVLKNHFNMLNVIDKYTVYFKASTAFNVTFNEGSIRITVFNHKYSYQNKSIPGIINYIKTILKLYE